METKVVKTSMGDIRCREYEDRLEFRGIKYATAGRWQYPKVIEKWNGVMPKVASSANPLITLDVDDEKKTTDNSSEQSTVPSQQQSSSSAR